MIRIKDIKIRIEEDCNEVFVQKIAKSLRINKDDIQKINIVKKSIDARKKPEVFYIYTFDVDVKNENKLIQRNPKLIPPLREKLVIKKYNNVERPVIVGAGPSGLFCAFILAKAGANPIIIEQGESVSDRKNTVRVFFEDNVLSEKSNIQYGEGGAGTFSDGKLNTSVKDMRNRYVLETLVKFGADEKILYENKPHVGTDILIKVVENMREEIKALGGKFIFNTKFKGIDISNNKFNIITDKNINLSTDKLVLALGNSARDTFLYLASIGMNIEVKPFAVGYRVQHSQVDINLANYGEKYFDKLGAADYKLTYKTDDGIAVYSFCMCPGGYVVNSSSELGQIAVNGMSYSGRNSKNANSAIIMSVSFDDIYSAINFQIDIEKRAYEKGEGSMPTMLYGDFKANRISESFGNITPQFKGHYTLGSVRGILPKELENAFVEAMEKFGDKIKNFNTDDVIVTAVESRTSSPVRMVRDDKYMSNIKNIYPIGEGAGYAGGIMSAAIDGIRVAQAILEG